MFLVEFVFMINKNETLYFTKMEYITKLFYRDHFPRIFIIDKGPILIKSIQMYFSNVQIFLCIKYIKKNIIKKCKLFFYMKNW